MACPCRHRRRRGGGGTPARVLLAVDQFEEVFTQAQDAAERRAFIDNLLHAATVAGGRTTVVLTLRADFLGRALSHPGPLAEALVQSQVVVLPIKPAQLRAAVQRPALQARARFDDGLVDTLVDAVVDQPGDLPLLQFTLRELWSRRDRAGLKLTWTAYNAINGVRGAIAARAEAFLNGPGLDDARRRELRRVLGRLVQIGDGPVDTRRRATREELEGLGSASVGPLLDRLIEERLLTARKDGIEVAHEALIREWKTLRAWIEADREVLAIHQDLSRDAKRWEARGRKEEDLWRGDRLADAARRISSGQLVASALEREFVAASRAADPQEVRRRRRRLAARVALALALGLIGIPAASAARLGWTWWTLPKQLEWVRIPAPKGGPFLMGCVPTDDKCDDDEKLNDSAKSHEVSLPRGFDLMAHEVTAGEFKRFVDGGPSTIVGRWVLPRVVMEPQPKWAESSHPVVNVYWHDATRFCKFVRGRLPTEAEWEYAARGDRTGRAELIYPWGKDYLPNLPTASELAGRTHGREAPP